jgi:hypothetical protein
MRNAGRYEAHSDDCVRDGAHAKERVGMRAKRGVVGTRRRVSDAGSVLEAMVKVQRSADPRTSDSAVKVMRSKNLPRMRQITKL